MSRLFVHVEGETEETFVNELLRSYLRDKGYISVSAKLLGNARARSRRGGITNWTSAKNDIVRHLKQDANIITTTMIDYYALPSGQPNGWPGRDAPFNSSVEGKAQLLENAILSEIADEMNVSTEMCRFVPYVMMYEFEGLLFSDCNAFARGVDMPEIAAQLRDIRDQFDTPEHINDSPLTAPSKRVTSIIRNYQKPLYGYMAADAIGIKSIVSECHNFARWISRLEDKV